jgi:hypothetical protein
MYIYSTYEYLLDRWIRIPFQGPDGGVEAIALGTDSLILIPLEDFPVAFLALFWGVGLAVAFRLLARVFDAPALDPAEGSSMASLSGGRAEMGVAKIGMSS